MTDEQSAQIVDSLSKIEKHLAAIDWKFWDLYQQFTKDKTNAADKEELSPIVGVDPVDELESLAEIINEIVKPAATLSPRPVAVPTAINQNSIKYPSIEILK